MSSPTEPIGPGPALDIQPGPGAHRAGPTPTADDSPLASLRARRAKLAEQLYTDVRVPGWGDDEIDAGGMRIYVRCRPLKPSELNGIREKRQKASKGKAGAGWLDLANADVLVTTCLEVWGLFGEPRDPAEVDEEDRVSLSESAGLHGAKTRFDEALARTLGMMDDSSSLVPGPVEVVRYLFLHDGAVMQATNQIVDFSGLGGTQEAEGFTAG